MSPAPKGVALVTGASGGLGAIYADRLARRGHDLILVARSRARLYEVAATLRAASGRTVEVVEADLCDPEGVGRIERLLRERTDIRMLVNNAGVGAVSGLLASDVDEMIEMINLNVTALTRFTLAAAPAFVSRRGGAIINVSSIVAIAPETLNGVYGATKAYVLALTRSLHHELGGRGLRVQAVLPGATATEFWEIAGTAIDNLPPDVVMDPEDAVDAALAGFDLGELVTIPSLPEIADWDAHEATRQALRPNLSLARPAARYGRGSVAPGPPQGGAAQGAPSAGGTPKTSEARS
jgi:short-subunit dehydrogenase